MIDYLFEIVGWDVVAEYFDDEEVVPIGEYTPAEAEILGYDTY